MNSTKGNCEDETIYTIIIGGQAPDADLLIGRGTFVTREEYEHKILAHTFKRSYDERMNYTSTEFIWISKKLVNFRFFLDPENKLGHTLDGRYGRIRTSATRHSMYYDVLLMAKIHSDDQYFEMNNSFKMSMNLD
jgi:hypothetical protein